MTPAGCWSGVDLDALDVDDLDRLATAAYLTGHDEEGFAHWVRAHQVCASRGEVHRAAYFGTKLAQGLGVQRRSRPVPRLGGPHAPASWRKPTSTASSRATSNTGSAMLRIFEAGDVAGAHAQFVQAGKIGARFAHRELITLARIGEGRMLIYLGEIAEGMALLDEAMVSIEAGELSPIATGDAYCTVIDACAELFDLARCRAWTESFIRWCDTQQELVLYRGHCFLHRAEVLELLGAWPEALVEAGTPVIGSPRPSTRRRSAALRDRGRSASPRRRPRRRGGRLPARQRARPRPPARPRAATTRRRASSTPPTR